MGGYEGERGGEKYKFKRLRCSSSLTLKRKKEDEEKTEERERQFFGTKIYLPLERGELATGRG